MANIFTLTVTDNGKDTKQAEVQQVSRALDLALHDVRSRGGGATSGTMYDDKGVVLGTWSYTGSATKTG